MEREELPILNGTSRVSLPASKYARSAIIRQIPSISFGPLFQKFQRAFPNELTLLSTVGISPIIPTHFLNPFTNRLCRTNQRIGVHSLGAAALAKVLGDLAVGSSLLTIDDISQLTRYALLHDALKYLEILGNESGIDIGPTTDDSVAGSVLATLRVDTKTIDELLTIRRICDPTTFIEDILVHDATGAIVMKREITARKLLLLSDYMSATNALGESLWLRVVLPAEKPIIAKWTEMYRGIETCGYGIDEIGRTIRIPNLEMCPSRILLIGNHLALQQEIGNAILNEVTRQLHVHDGDDHSHPSDVRAFLVAQVEQVTLQLHTTRSQTTQC